MHDPKNDRAHHTYQSGRAVWSAVCCRSIYWRTAECLRQADWMVAASVVELQDSHHLLVIQWYHPSASIGDMARRNERTVLCSELTEWPPGIAG